MAADGFWGVYEYYVLCVIGYLGYSCRVEVGFLYFEWVWKWVEWVDLCVSAILLSSPVVWILVTDI